MMLTLGIETSCDETSCAVLEGKDKLRSNVIASSLFRHKPYGGVVPEIASRHALEQIDTVLKEALKTARVRLQDIDLVTVTEGPGLIGSLLVGISFAKSLSYQLGIPLVGVNHLEAHLAANFIGRKRPSRFIGLLVSGGHTSLSYHEKEKVKLLGKTVDDAAGEAFDKVAKMLGLDYPGGPVIERLAKEGNPAAFRFTKPKQKNIYDFSFSGIKTAVYYEVRKRSPLPLEPSFIRNIARSFQDAVTGWLVEKTLRAAKAFNVREILAGGGVLANQYLRKLLLEEAEISGRRVGFPQRELTLDNAGMIARRGLDLYRQGRRSSLRLTGNPRLSLGSVNGRRHKP